ncbi:MAG: alpha/beta fold hydrolase [Bacteriovoracaceae bacterium]|nr:alpha/beta fold hydrolase [Bacteriovoracaceae bacterium]
MKFLIALILFNISAAFACPKPWVCETVAMTVPYTTASPYLKFTTENIRAGYIKERGIFKGNILYFQGLADSIVNHLPLFETLSLNGYRVIAFDYMGQGGSSGSMNRTRIETIPLMGEIIWKKMARIENGKNKKTILGWSTGGLAAYMYAAKKKVDQVILIAPGIVPKAIMGEGLTQWPLNRISLESLTSASRYYSQAEDPHLDPIKPESPLMVPAFAIDLLSVAHQSKYTKISNEIPGFVLLSGRDDSYVDGEKTLYALKKNAPHFKSKIYEGALHEIDNEIDLIRFRAYSDILRFLKSNAK